MRDLVQRILWVTTGRTPRPVVAFDWIRGRVGSRQNPDGMRSLIHAGLALAVLCAAADLLSLLRHDGAAWAILAFLHTGWAFGFTLVLALNVGFLETLDGRQLRRLGGPNVVTLARALLLPTLIYLILCRDFRLAAVSYLVLAVTDVVDGWWARHGGGQSKMGIVLDPVVDLTFHLGVFVSLTRVDLLGPVALVLVLVRTALLVFGSGWLYLWKGQVRIQPTPLGKCTGFLLSAGTFLLLWSGAAAGGSGPAARAVDLLRGLLTWLLLLTVLHALAIGMVNLRVPPAAEARWPGGHQWPRDRRKEEE